MARYEFSVNERFRRKDSGLPFFGGPELDEDYELIDDIMSGISNWADENGYTLDTDYCWGAGESYAEFDILCGSEEILTGKLSHINISERAMPAKGSKRGSRRKINVEVSGEIEAEGPEIVKAKEEELEEWLYSQVK